MPPKVLLGFLALAVAAQIACAASAPAPRFSPPTATAAGASEEADLMASPPPYGYAKSPKPYNAKYDGPGELYPPTFSEEQAARALQWVCFMLSMILSMFYFYQYYIGTSKWEVLYVVFFETIAYVFEIWFLHVTPVSLVFKQGHSAKWIRYTEWLLTCPIILIALSRVGVAEGSYSKRTMRLLTSDQGTILMGVTAAFSQGFVRLGFYMFGLAFGLNTFYTAAAVYLEAWRNVPDTEKNVVKYMALLYYASWLMFPILFAIGKEGLGYLTTSGSAIGHCVADILSKNLWGLFEWYLEYCVHSRYHAELAALEEEGEEEDEEGEDGAGGAHGGHGALAAAALRVPYDMEHKARVAVVTGGPWTMEWFQEKLKGTPAEVTPCSNLQMLQMALGGAHHFDYILIDRALCTNDTLRVLKETYRVSVVVFADGGEKAVEALKAQWEGLADEVVAGPQQGEAYHGDIKHLFQEWHGKFVHRGGKGGHAHAHHGGGKGGHSEADLHALGKGGSPAGMMMPGMMMMGAPPGYPAGFAGSPTGSVRAPPMGMAAAPVPMQYYMPAQAMQGSPGHGQVARTAVYTGGAPMM